VSEAHKPVGAIFDAAIELPPRRRAAYLQEACGGDAALRRRVEALLRAHETAGTFMDSPAVASREEPAGVKLAEQPGDRIGRYKLLQQIGEGGCGVVYMAEQEEPVHRRVALKVIKLGMDTKNVIARFEAERQALALMDHPNIAKVLDAGATETGRPYFVMELVKAIPITRYCDENNLSTAARLGLFIQVCQAIQHAHQKGIIHRDIKPSNVLVADHDGVPVPKIIDFGIAKATTGQRLTDKTLFTALEQFIGTPAYMSPEQAKFSGLDIDTRSDIYSLGVLLYELLTGKTPFEAKRLLEAGLDEIRRIIREEEPVPPSTRLHTLDAAEQTTVAKHRQSDPPKLVSMIRGDLDWIVMKALEKDRARRYETANGLAMDIERHLSNEPVLARPPSNLYLFQKLVRRNKLVFAAGVVIATLLILGLCAAAVAVVRIKRDDQQVRKANDAATERLWASYLAETRAMRISGREGQRFASLDSVRNAAAIRADLVVRNEAIASLAMSDLRVSKQASPTGRVPNDLVCYDFNLEKYAIGEVDGSITIHSVANDQALSVLPAPGFTVVWISGFSPNSRYLKARYLHDRETVTDWVWDLEQQKAVLRELPGDLANDFSSDSRFFAKCDPGGTLSIYDLGSGKEFKRLPGTRRFNNLVLNPGNTSLACSSDDDTNVEIRDVESGRNILTWPCPSNVLAIAWSPDGRRLATGCKDFNIYIWDAENGRRQTTLQGHSQPIISMLFNHAGNLLASSSFENLTRLWNTESGRQIASHSGEGWHVQFSPDDRYLLGLQEGARRGLLEVAESKEFRLLCPPRTATGLSGPEFSAEGRIVSVGNYEQVRFWDAFYGKEIASFPLQLCDTHIFHPDGRSMIVADRLGGVSLRSLERTGDPSSPAYHLGKPRRFYAGGRLCDAALSLDGRHLAVTHESEGESLVFDLQDPSAKPLVLHPHPRVDRIAISPDARWVATASWHNSFVKVWDARSGDLVCTLPMPAAMTTVAFSPDGRWLATSTTEYQLWEVGSWKPKGPPKPGYYLAEANFTAFSPDGRVMARTIEGCNIQLLETLTEKPLATLEAPTSSTLSRFQFSPDGSHLAATQWDQHVQLWDLRLIRQELKSMGLDWDLPPYPPVEKGMASGPVTLEVESDPSSTVPIK
jgi:serine/threonine protein kinase/WD40 repeat protein